MTRKSEKKAQADSVFCYCLSNNGHMHCPLSTDRSQLERTFNYQVRGEAIVEVEIDQSFVCDKERKASCENCPFK